VVECTGLENRRPFTGLVSSNLTLSAIGTIKMGPSPDPILIVRSRVRGRTHPSSTKSPGAILDAGALWRRRAKREGREGPSQSHPLRHFCQLRRRIDATR
jgi:hypothetical protein